MLYHKETSRYDDGSNAMNIQDLVQTLIGNAEKNPALLGNMLEHPYSTIGNLTGNNNVSKE